MADVAALFGQLKDRFYPPAVREIAGSDRKVIYQFKILDAGNYYISIENEQCTVAEGQSENPSITLILESDTLSSVIDGSLSGAQAFMFGKETAEGQLSLATHLSAIFSA